MEGVVTGRRCNEHDEMRRVVGRSVHIVFYPLNTSNGIGIEPIRRTPKGSLPGNFWETPRFLHAFCFSMKGVVSAEFALPGFLVMCQGEWKLTLVVIGAKDLENISTFGKLDPYVRVMLRKFCLSQYHHEGWWSFT